MHFLDGISGGIISLQKEALIRTRQRMDLLINDSAHFAVPGYKGQGAQFNMFLENSYKKTLFSPHKQDILNRFNALTNSQRIDGNGVDYEATLMAKKETETHYIVTANLLSKNLNMFKDTLREIK